MSVPISQMATVAWYVLKQRLLGRRRYPLVLMLEPLLRCNLACAGCGKIQYPGHVLRREMPLEQALAAVDECGAPVVSIPGGEPLLYSQIAELVRELVRRRKYIYLCTNALLLKKRLEEGIFTPSKYLTFSVHMDGEEEAHDFAVCREGVYRKAEEAIRLAVEMGFRVTTNTTLFQHADPESTRRFFDRMTEIGVESMMVSPGYSYSKAPDQQSFLQRERTWELFRKLFYRPKKGWKFNHSPLFLEYLMGQRHFECTPWGNPCYTIFGWQRPCYLLQEGYASTFAELLEQTDWSRYGRASGNPKCRDCMVHCGHEPTAVDYTFRSLRGLMETIRATVLGVDGARRRRAKVPPVTRRSLTAKEGARPGTLEYALWEAMDYRGDVTLEFHDGSELVCYVYNFDGRKVDYLPAGGDGPARSLPASRIRGVRLSGKDFAEGKSWEAWVQKYRLKKAEQARARKLQMAS
ncbi:MAG: hypothetical protein KatS3mg102_0067 [Planctomycetota bacterium]|nr:MAG: hypothetical protein KatS3mg102_0067 [Planctomycetota bacterium]